MSDDADNFVDVDFEASSASGGGAGDVRSSRRGVVSNLLKKKNKRASQPEAVADDKSQERAASPVSASAGSRGPNRGQRAINFMRRKESTRNDSQRDAPDRVKAEHSRRQLPKFVRHKRQQAWKFDVIVQLHRVSGLDERWRREHVFLAWRRGAHHQGTTVKAAVDNDGTAVWEESTVNLQVTLYDSGLARASSAGQNRYDEKRMQIALRQSDASKKKGRLIGEAEFDISPLANGVGDTLSTHFLTLELRSKKGNELVGKVAATLKLRRDPSGVVVAPNAEALGLSSDEEEAEEEREEAASEHSEGEKRPKSPQRASEARRRRKQPADEDDSDSTSQGKSPRTRSTGGSAVKRVRGKKGDALGGATRSSATSAASSAHGSPQRASAAGASGRLKQSLQMASVADLAEREERLGQRMRGGGDASDDEDSDDVEEVDGGDESPRDPSPQGQQQQQQQQRSASRPIPTVMEQDEGALPPRLASSPSADKSASAARLASLRAQNKERYAASRRATDSVSPVPMGMSPGSSDVDGLSLFSGDGDDSGRTSNDGSSLPVGTDAMQDALRAKDMELERLKQQLVAKEQEEDKRFLVDEAIVAAEPVYSPGGVPVSTYVIFRALLHWRAFDHGNEGLLTAVIDGIEKVVRRSTTAHDRSLLLYWLASISVLMHVLRHELQLTGTSLDGGSSTNVLLGVPDAAASASGTASLSSSTTTPSYSSGQHMRMSRLATSKSNTAQHVVLQHFTEQLREQLRVCYHALLDVFMERARHLLVPGLLEGDMANPERNADVRQRIRDALDEWAVAFAERRVAQSIERQFFYQVFADFNSYLMDQLLERRDLCRCGNGLLVKMNVLSLEEWAASRCVAFKEAFATLLQAADVLVMNKGMLIEASSRSEVCPDVNPLQLKRLLSHYTPDEYDPEPIHPGVLAEIQREAERARQSSTASGGTVDMPRKVRSLKLDGMFVSEPGGEPVSSPDLAEADAYVPKKFLVRAGFSFLRSAQLEAIDEPF